MTTSTLTARRVSVPPLPRPGDAGIRLRYPIDSATWIWHPSANLEQRSFVRFVLEFTSDQAEEIELEISADQRFILECDGVEIGRGPDRSELGGWSCHRYHITLPAGNPTLSAIAWWLPENERPAAQVSAKPAFAIVGLGEAHARLSTGVAPWRVQALGGWNVYPADPLLFTPMRGVEFEFDGSVPDGPLLEPKVIVEPPLRKFRCGIISTPWRCEPSPLQEQHRVRFSGGRIRAVQADHDRQIRAETDAGDWAGLPTGQAVTVPPHSKLQVLWDFEDYVCGYAELDLAGGAKSTVEISWSESLYESEGPNRTTPKGNRAECAGKFWIGLSECVRHPGGARQYAMPWWNSGRWLRLSVSTSDEALVIHNARPLRTGYPYSRKWAFNCDQDLGGMLELCERSLINCVHDTFVDCPFYEQLQYVGDTRIQALAWLVASGDATPVRRALEIFDRSRWVNGFVAESCPTNKLQMSGTYSLIQPSMLRDYAWWADDPQGVRDLLPGTRCALEQAIACIDTDGLPSLLPGWLFVDWIPKNAWPNGVPGRDELFAPIALHLPLALDAAAQVEDAYGDKLVADRWRRIGKAVLARIQSVFYKTERALFSDDPAGTCWSEHAQALALDCSWLPQNRREALIKALENPVPEMTRASVYFSHHIHEALLKGGRVDAVLKRFDFWKELRRQGFLTAVESPEPSRSDCHGWGAHPLYHCLTYLAGVRPTAAGFASVGITPRFGALSVIDATVPHPHGSIQVALRRTGTTLNAKIETPVPGLLFWAGEELPLQVGKNELEVRP